MGGDGKAALRGSCGLWEATAKRRSVAPVASERVAGVPSLTVRAGGLVRGVPACLVVTPPSAASAEFSCHENTPCSAPSTVWTCSRNC